MTCVGGTTHHDTAGVDIVALERGCNSELMRAEVGWKGDAIAGTHLVLVRVRFGHEHGIRTLPRGPGCARIRIDQFGACMAGRRHFEDTKLSTPVCVLYRSALSRTHVHDAINIADCLDQLRIHRAAALQPGVDVCLKRLLQPCADGSTETVDHDADTNRCGYGNGQRDNGDAGPRKSRCDTGDGHTCSRTTQAACKTKD